MITLWQYNKVTGYWLPIHALDDQDTANQYLDIFRKDNPEGIYRLAKRRPPYPAWGKLPAHA